MKIFKETIHVTSVGGRPSYHNITEEVREIVKKSGVQNGLCVVQSQHTTCSVIFEEFVHDTDFNGDEYLQVDLNKILERIVPREVTDSGEYRYPGPKHLDFLMSLDDPQYPKDPGTILNGDAHIRGSLFGASESFILEKGTLLTGSVGYIYFIDWDQNRSRKRTCHVMVMGE
ncbi:MAG: YjbQ family protein [Ruthenibacterium sp.]